MVFLTLPDIVVSLRNKLLVPLQTHSLQTALSTENQCVSLQQTQNFCALLFTMVKVGRGGRGKDTKTGPVMAFKFYLSYAQEKTSRYQTIQCYYIHTATNTSHNNNEHTHEFENWHPQSSEKCK